MSQYKYLALCPVREVPPARDLPLERRLQVAVERDLAVLVHLHLGGGDQRVALNVPIIRVKGLGRIVAHCRHLQQGCQKRSVSYLSSLPPPPPFYKKAMPDQNHQSNKRN